MKFNIYVYSANNFRKMHDSLKETYTFSSLANIFNACETINDISSILELDKTIIDLTNLSKGNNYYKLFIERYLEELVNCFEALHFCIQVPYVDIFRDEYPVFCLNAEFNDEFSIIQEIDDGQSLEQILNYNSLLNLYTYSNYSTIKSLIKENHAMQFSKLSELDKTTVSRIIVDNAIEYIDITSIVSRLKYYPEHTFNAESLLHLINVITKGGIRFSIYQDMKALANEIFPLLFDDSQQIDEEVEPVQTLEIEENSIGLDEKKLTEISDSIQLRLQGHKDFKVDFDRCLTKFYILNKLKERRILSIFLCGDSGIGKTEFAKLLSDIIYPGEPLIKINFGNYSTEGVLNSLIGSPRGYIGSEDGGELINKLANSRTQVVLIDEFERATPSVFNFFYELLEDGKFTDRMGNEHNMDGFIIIFTSNLKRDNYHKVIPSPLFSRFDMKYVFEQLSETDKVLYIKEISKNLVELLTKEYRVEVDMANISSELNKQSAHQNLREIKRNVEEIIISKFYEQYLGRLTN